MSTLSIKKVHGFEKMEKQHLYTAIIEWTGNLGKGTQGYQNYGRDHIIGFEDKPAINGSSDPAFRGDRSKHNPEDLLVASISACHMLWYLHLCSSAGVIVEAYSDRPVGKMTENPDGSGQFTEVVLHPTVVVRDTHMKEKAALIHSDVHRYCFIAKSVNFPVFYQPIVESKS
jgi:organic hydroperoxide reductase OsmC/OhrA